MMQRMPDRRQNTLSSPALARGQMAGVMLPRPVGQSRDLWFMMMMMMLTENFVKNCA